MRPTFRLAFVAVALACGFALASCRLLGIDTSVPCNGKADCPSDAPVCTAHVAGAAGVCAKAPGGEGEGEGAPGEGEGAEGEGAPGEGEGAEGEGEGAITLPDEPHLIDLLPTRNEPVDGSIENHGAVDVVDVADCTASCTTVGGPDARPAIGAPLSVPGAQPIPGAAMLLEAVIDLPPQPAVPASPVPVFSIVDDNSGGSIRATLEADAGAGDIDLVVTFASASGGTLPPASDLVARRHLGLVARGWTHLFCGLDDGTLEVAAVGAFGRAQCFLNAERFGVETTGGPFAPAATAVAVSSTIATSVPTLSIAMWDAGAFASIESAFAGGATDPQVQQDALLTEARLRLATWAGVPASSTALPTVPGQPSLSSLVPLFPAAASEVAMRDGVVGPVSFVTDAGAEPTTIDPGAPPTPAVTWLMPGWPRVISDATSHFPAILVEQARTSFVGDTTATFRSAGMTCTSAPGPSGDASDAESCQSGTASLPVSGTGARVASILAQVGGAAGATATATFGSCTFALTATTVTPSASCATPEALAPSTSGGPLWFRLTAPVATGATGVPIGVAAGGTAVFALPMADADDVVTTPLVPRTSAATAAIVYPIEGAAASGVEITALVDALDAQSAGALATVVTNAQPASDVQLFMSGVNVELNDSGSSAPQSAAFVPGTRYDAQYALPGGTSVATCPGCTAIAFTPTSSGAASTASVFVVGGPLAPNNARGVALVENVVAIERITLDVAGNGTITSPPPDVDVTFTGVPPGGFAIPPAQAPLTFSAAVSSFDAHAGTQAGTGFPQCDSSATFVPAPTASSSSAFQPASAGCRSFVQNEDVPLGSGRLLVDALFQVVPTANNQRIAGWQGNNNRNLVIEVPATGTTSLGNLTTIRVSDNGRTFDLAPPGASPSTPVPGYDGWVYLACIVHGSATPPACTVNAQPATAVVEQNQNVDVAEKAEIGANSGSSQSLAKGPIAFVHVWTVPSGANGLVAAAEPAFVASLAAQLFGIAPSSSSGSSSSPVTPSYARAAVATALLLDGNGGYQVFDVARDWPRFAVVDANAAAHPGYLTEGAATNYLRSSVDPVFGAWQRSSGVGDAGGATGPRATGQIASLGAGDSLTQDLSAPAGLFTEAPDGNAYDVAASVWVHGGKPELRISAKQPPPGNGVLSFLAVLETNGQCTTTTATCTVTPPDTFGWRRMTVTAQVPADSVSMTFKVTNNDAALHALVTAPQLEVGAFATSYMPTVLAGGEPRPADDLTYVLDGPVAFSGSLDVTTTIPGSLPSFAEAVVASVANPVDGVVVVRPAIDWRNDKIAFPEPRKLSADNGEPTQATTDINAAGRFEVLGTWRHGTATVSLVPGPGLGGPTLQASTSNDAIPPHALVVGAVAAGSGVSASSLPCGACAVGETIEHVVLHFDAP